MASELVVLARRLAREELDLELLDCEVVTPSESDSGTVSSWGSLLCEQVQRPPWLQQQLSAKRDDASQRSRALINSDMTMLTLVTLDHRSQVHALVCLLTAIAFDVSRARLAHRPAVLALRHRPALLVDVLEGPICGWVKALLAFTQLPRH